MATAGLVLCAAPALADTPAGSVIVNVAQLSYTADRQTATISSNAQRTIVAERLDVTLTGGAITQLADGSLAVQATLTNAGNGREAFAVAATTSPDDERVVAVAVDNGDGRYDPATDTASDGRTPELSAGKSITLFAILRPATAGTVSIDARAMTGSGAAGTAFPAAGDGGGDAVTGATGARASVTIALVDTPTDRPSLTKEAVVLAPDGSARAVRGASIAYTLVARFPGRVDTAEITDPIPVGTRYVAGSLTLDDAPLSDAGDGDAGDAVGGRVSVALRSQGAGAVHTIRFKVIIE